MKFYKRSQVDSVQQSEKNVATKKDIAR